MNTTIYEDLMKEADYALNSKSLNLTYEVYGKAKMARKLCAITKEQFFELNEKLIVKGVNNPKAGLE